MRLQVTGLDEVISKLEKTGKRTVPVFKEAVYNGARPVADQLKKNLHSLPVEQDVNGGFPRRVTGDKKLKGLTRRQKEDVTEAMGIAPIKNETGNVNTSIGFDGYGSMPTRKYPNGIPNRMLIRSVESGTSFRAKTPIVRPALNTSKATSIARMEETIRKEIGKEFE